MAKDPAFLFYPGDWLGGTIGMSFEEKGAYMELLMMQFTRGHMTKHMIGQTVGQLWVKLEDKFTQDASGLWYNERLDLEKERRKNFVTSRKNNINGTNQHTKGKGHMTSHMENVNRNENIINTKESFDLKFTQAFDESTMGGYKLAFRTIDLPNELKLFKLKCDNDKQTYYHRDSAGLRTAFQYQLKNARKNPADKTEVTQVYKPGKAFGQDQ